MHKHMGAHVAHVETREGQTNTQRDRKREHKFIKKQLPKTYKQSFVMHGEASDKGKQLSGGSRVQGAAGQSLK